MPTPQPPCTHPLTDLYPITAISCECGAIVHGGVAYHPPAPGSVPPDLLSNVVAVLRAAEVYLTAASNGKHNASRARGPRQLCSTAADALTDLLAGTEPAPGTGKLGVAG